MGKLEGWEVRLVAELRAWERKPFVWGSSDCFALCIACRTAITGIDWPLPPYASELDAARGLRKLGFGSLAEMVSFKCREIPVSNAQRGDIVMRQGLGLIPGSFGVVAGQHAAFMSEGGLVYLPVLESERAWSIQ